MAGEYDCAADNANPRPSGIHVSRWQIVRAWFYSLTRPAHNATALPSQAGDSRTPFRFRDIRFDDSGSIFNRLSRTRPADNAIPIPVPAYEFMDLHLDEPGSVLKSQPTRPDKKCGFKHLLGERVPPLKRWPEERLVPDEIRVRSGGQTSKRMRSRRIRKRGMKSRLGSVRAKSISGDTLGPGSTEWPRFVLNKGPSEPGSDVATLSWRPDEVRVHNQKLMTRFASLFTKHVENAVSPILGAAAAALQDTLLELEERQLALKMHLNRRSVRRSQRRWRASSAKPLRQCSQLEFKQEFEEFDVKPTIFSYNELKAATRDFHADMKLGQGGYGAVYKGVLSNGNVVAVKQLFTKTAQGLGEFANEVFRITGMKHRNLVNLKGCCLREHQRLLVYEHVDNYDVDQILLGTIRRQALGWSLRLKICLGVARGLHYLHGLALPRVIHRDIKASNVLLDKNLEPKIADFSLALLFPDEESHIMTTHVAGTKGYLAPEYASLGQLSDKVDVYSFGVLCLEIISGRRNINDTMPPDQMYLTQWARLLNLTDHHKESVVDYNVSGVLD